VLEGQGGRTVGERRTPRVPAERGERERVAVARQPPRKERRRVLDRHRQEAVPRQSHVAQRRLLRPLHVEAQKVDGRRGAGLGEGVHERA
jgi:hypothetical protein